MVFDETRDCKNCYCHLVCAIYNPDFDNYAPECNLYMGMDYKTMWNKFKLKLERDLKYHQSGNMQSMSEAIHGEVKCQELLSYMANEEIKYEF